MQLCSVRRAIWDFNITCCFMVHIRTQNTLIKKFVGIPIQSPHTHNQPIIKILIQTIKKTIHNINTKPTLKNNCDQIYTSDFAEAYYLWLTHRQTQTCKISSACVEIKVSEDNFMAF